MDYDMLQPTQGHPTSHRAARACVMARSHGINHQHRQRNCKSSQGLSFARRSDIHVHSRHFYPPMSLARRTLFSSLAPISMLYSIRYVEISPGRWMHRSPPRTKMPMHRPAGFGLPAIASKYSSSIPGSRSLASSSA